MLTSNPRPQTPNPHLLFIGCGKMGGAMLQRVAHGASICVVDPAPMPGALKSLSGITWLPAPDRIDPKFRPDIVIIAIKPQQVDAVLPSYGHFGASVFLSIAAGKTLAHIADLLGGDAHAIVRAMPNLPASVGQGMTVAVANKYVTPAKRALCDGCLKAVGEVAWIEDESWLDIVTGLSGGGPAYVFALTEAMAKAGEALGLPPAFAAKLARQTVIGSGALLAQSTEIPEALRAAVTSPGGTTEAALKQFLAQNGLFDLMLKAMRAAAQRAKELL